MSRYQTRQAGEQARSGGALGVRMGGINQRSPGLSLTTHTGGSWANQAIGATQDLQRLGLQQFGMDRQRRLDDETWQNRQWEQDRQLRLDDETQQNRQWEQDRHERLDRMGALQWGLGFGTEQQKLQAHADMLRKQLGIQDAAEKRAQALFDRGEKEWSADAANRDARRQAEGKMWSDYLKGAQALGLAVPAEGETGEGGEAGATGGAVAGAPGALVPNFAGGKTGLQLRSPRPGKAAKAPKEWDVDDDVAADAAKMAERMGFDVSGLWAPDKSAGVLGLEGTPKEMSDKTMAYWKGALKRARREGGARSIEEAVMMVAGDLGLRRAGVQQQTPAAPSAKQGWLSRVFGGGPKDAAKQAVSTVNQAIPTPKGVRREDALAILSKARERAKAEGGPAGEKRLQQIEAVNNALAQGVGVRESSFGQSEYYQGDRPKPPTPTRGPGGMQDFVNALAPDEDVSGAPLPSGASHARLGFGQGLASIGGSGQEQPRGKAVGYKPGPARYPQAPKQPVAPDRTKALDDTLMAGLSELRDYGNGDAPPSTPPAQLGAQAFHDQPVMPSPEQSGAAAFYKKAGEPGQPPVNDAMTEQALAAVAAGPQYPADTSTPGGLTTTRRPVIMSTIRPDGTLVISGPGSGRRPPAKKAAPVAKPQDWLSQLSQADVLQAIAADPQSRAKALGIVRYAQALGLTPDDAKAMVVAQVFSGQRGQVR